MPASGLKYQSSLDARGHRPAGRVDPRRRREDEGGAAPRLQADRARAGQRGRLLGPGAGCVEHHRRLVSAWPPAATCQLPAHALQRGDLGLADDAPAGAADAAQEALVDGVHVHVGGVGLVARRQPACRAAAPASARRPQRRRAARPLGDSARSTSQCACSCALLRHGWRPSWRRAGRARDARRTRREGFRGRRDWPWSGRAPAACRSFP